MQAIARVNRVFKDKPGGLVVDYLGLADELKKALATYTEAGGTGKTAVDQAEAVALMLAKHEVCLPCSTALTGHYGPPGRRRIGSRYCLLAQEHILAQDDGKSRFMDAVNELSKAFALAVPSEELLRIADDVGFFQSVRAAAGQGRSE